MNLKDETFLSRIFIQKLTTAILEAPRDKSDLVLWADESKLQSGKVGTAVVWKNASTYRWKSCKLALEKN